MSPAIEAVAMTWPPPASIMSGRKVSAVQTTPLRLTSVIQSSSLSVSSVTGMNDVAPALANTSWMVPSAALASAFICSIDERSQTSQWIATAVPPASLISPATLRALSGRMSATATEAPWRASSLARPMPMPLPPPVTTAALPVISVMRSLRRRACRGS